jgi:hypothetical protein
MLVKMETGASGGSGGGKLVTYASATSDSGNNYNLTKDGEVIIIATIACCACVGN